MGAVRELTIEERVKKVLAVMPSFVDKDEVITLTAALACGGNRATQRIEQIADDIEGLNETRTLLRQKYTALREEIEQEMKGLATVLAGA